jgi:hypothetical protein
MQEVAIKYGLTSKPPEKAEETVYRKNEGTHKVRVPNIANNSAGELDFSSKSYLSPRAANRGFHMYKDMSGKETHMTTAVSVGI